MPGGEMNLIYRGSGGGQVILTGNPTKSFFTAKYAKYSNFGLQKFRLDYDGQRDLRTTEQSTFTFKVKRYGDLLLDTYVVINLPDIWSPIYHPCQETGNEWAPYEFKWIENLGTQLIKEVVIACGNYELQRYSGNYLMCMAERDFSADKRQVYDKMTGHVPELHSPENCNSRVNVYPNAFYQSGATGAEPSIRGRTLYIPLGAWFTLDSKLGFPLVSSRYNELTITVTLRPICEIFTVRDIFDVSNQYPHVRPDFNQAQFQMYRFLQTPPAVDLSPASYQTQVNTWNSDIHLLCTQAFLSEDERLVFAREDQAYLIKNVNEYRFNNIAGASRQKLQSLGMVSGWMFFFQRNDAGMRNEWSNYTNYPYGRIPSNVIPAPKVVQQFNTSGPYYNPDGTPTGFFITGALDVNNRKDILDSFAVVLNGEYRENPMTRGIFEYVEKYGKTKGLAKDGLYMYQFALNSDASEYQPSGAINMSNFKNVEIEVSTLVPEIDLAASNVQVICNSDGAPIGVVKQNWRLYEYNFDLVVLEERYNVLTFIGGNCGLLYAK